MDIDGVQTGLGAAVTGLVGYDGVTQLRGYPALPDAIEPPVFAVAEYELEYHGTFQNRGMLTGVFTCGLFVANDKDRGRQMLSGWLNPESSSSVPKALEVDKTLGGTCLQLVVLRVRGAYRLYEVGGTDYLGAMIDVKVWG